VSKDHSDHLARLSLGLLRASASTECLLIEVTACQADVAAAALWLTQQLSALRAMLLSALSVSSLFGDSVHRMRSVFSATHSRRCNLPSGLPPGG
jgi:hypothetical protein